MRPENKRHDWRDAGWDNKLRLLSRQPEMQQRISHQPSVDVFVSRCHLSNEIGHVGTVAMSILGDLTNDLFNGHPFRGEIGLAPPQHLKDASSVLT